MPMKDAASKVAGIPDRLQPRIGAFRRARWKQGLYSPEALAGQKRVRELLAKSRELLKQMQAG
jgi:hypothetical protein